MRGMGDDNKYRTLVSRVFLKIILQNSPQTTTEAGLRRVMMVPKQPSEVDVCSPDAQCLQSYSTQAVFLANPVQGNTVRLACMVHIFILHLL